MTCVQLIDYFGFVIGEPRVPDPFPKVLVWGCDFFVVNEEDILNKAEKPRYHITSGHIITETKETRVLGR